MASGSCTGWHRCSTRLRVIPLERQRRGALTQPHGPLLVNGCFWGQWQLCTWLNLLTPEKAPCRWVQVFAVRRLLHAEVNARGCGQSTASVCCCIWPPFCRIFPFSASLFPWSLRSMWQISIFYFRYLPQPTLSSLPLRDCVSEAPLHLTPFVTTAATPLRLISSKSGTLLHLGARILTMWPTLLRSLESSLISGKKKWTPT